LHLGAGRYFGEHCLQIALFGMEREKLKPVIVDGAGYLRRDLVWRAPVKLQSIGVCTALRGQNLNALDETEPGDQRLQFALNSRLGMAGWAKGVTLR